MKKRDFALGAKAALPIVLSFIPVGIAYGLMARNAGFSAAETVSMSLLVYAGAAQMMCTGMFAQNMGAAAIILATFVLNLRHVVMSTCVMDRLREVPLGRKLLLSFGVTDETFAVYTTLPEGKGGGIFFLGLTLTAYASWLCGSAIGAFAAALLPDVITASFGVAMYAMFVGLIVPDLKGKNSLALVLFITGALCWLLGLVIPESWAVIAATLLGALAGVFIVPDEGRAGA